jgi:hypothetical protein
MSAKLVLSVAVSAALFLFVSCSDGDGGNQPVPDPSPEISSSSEANAVSSSSQVEQSSSSDAASSSSEETNQSSSSSEESEISSSSEASIVSSSSQTEQSSSSEAMSSSSQEVAVACSDYEEGADFCDTRDGQVYAIKKINGIDWLAENLNYAAPGSLCYDNRSANCSLYGRLYTWETAQTVCPDGWRLPTGISEMPTKGMDWNTLGGTYESPGTFHGAGESGFWWTLEQSAATTAPCWGSWGGECKDLASKSDAMSVRCVRGKAPCGESDSYDPRTQFCFEKESNSFSVYNKCGGEAYNPSIQICERMPDEVVRPIVYFATVQIGTQIWMAENLGDYTWAEAQLICPTSWRLPSKTDFEALLQSNEISDILSDWGTNSALGYWTSTESDWAAYYCGLSSDEWDRDCKEFGQKTSKYSVRCLKDE